MVSRRQSIYSRRHSSSSSKSKDTSNNSSANTRKPSLGFSIQLPFFSQKKQTNKTSSKEFNISPYHDSFNTLDASLVLYAETVLTSDSSESERYDDNSDRTYRRNSLNVPILPFGCLYPRKCDSSNASSTQYIALRRQSIGNSIHSHLSTSIAAELDEIEASNISILENKNHNEINSQCSTFEEVQSSLLTDHEQNQRLIF